MQGQQAAFSDADHSQRQRRLADRPERVDGCLHFLDLVADHVSTQFEGHPVDELTVRLVGVADTRVAGKLGIAADQRRYDHSTAVFDQSPGQLFPGSHARRQAGKLLGCPVGIRQGNHVGHRRGCRGQHQAPGGDAVEHVPAGQVSRPALGAAHTGGMFESCDQLDLGGTGAGIDGSDDRPEPRPVGRDALGVRLMIREVLFPSCRAFGSRTGQCSKCESVDSGDHHHVQRLGESQGFGARERFGVLSGKSRGDCQQRRS